MRHALGQSEKGSKGAKPAIESNQDRTARQLDSLSNVLRKYSGQGIIAKYESPKRIPEVYGDEHFAVDGGQNWHPALLVAWCRARDPPYPCVLRQKHLAFGILAQTECLCPQTRARGTLLLARQKPLGNTNSMVKVTVTVTATATVTVEAGVTPRNNLRMWLSEVRSSTLVECVMVSFSAARVCAIEDPDAVMAAMPGRKEKRLATMARPTIFRGETRQESVVAG